MNYVQITPPQRQAMLDAIGVERVEELYASLPEAYQLKAPIPLTGLASGLSELALRQRLSELTAKNRPAVADDAVCFMGGGAYDHFIPAAVDALAGKGEFVTAYTPYQAEASQGSLQAFFEFQTQVCLLAGLEVANASLYEGSTAAAEAVMLALNATGKRQVLVAGTVHPHTRAVIQTYLSDLPARYVELPADARTGRLSVEGLTAALTEAQGDAACAIVQSPNVLGRIEDWQGLFNATHAATTPDGASAGTLGVAVFNPIACGLLKRPGDCGADLAVAEGQPLGIPLQMGGPWLGLFAARQSLMRKMPGRLVGQTVDSLGRRAFCLTLQTREQHIRRDKATSNVCTNQGLMAMRATIFMSTLGPQGLRETAEQCWHKAHHLAGRIAAIPGYALLHEGPFFHEFVVQCPLPAAKIIDAGRGCSPRILPGVDCSALGIGTDHQLLVAVTEKRSVAQLDALVDLLKACR